MSDPFEKVRKFPRRSFGHKKFVASRFTAFQKPREKRRSASPGRPTWGEGDKWLAQAELAENDGVVRGRGGGRSDYRNAAVWVSPVNEEACFPFAWLIPCTSTGLPHFTLHFLLEDNA